MDLARARLNRSRDVGHPTCTWWIEGSPPDSILKLQVSAHAIVSLIKSVPLCSGQLEEHNDVGYEIKPNCRELKCLIHF